MKFPRDLSGSAVVKGLERLDFVVVRQSGSHVRLVRGDKRVTVPLHRILAIGTLRNILRQAGLNIEALMDSL